MRKTKIRRRFRKRATPKKTRKNIHKSKKHINSRRYSRRRVMRGGTDDDMIDFNPDTILLGYGNYNNFMIFILYSKSDEKFYFYNYENKRIENISSSSIITIYLPIAKQHPIADVDTPDTIHYIKEHFDNIIKLFENNNINYTTKDVRSISSRPLPINIKIKDKVFLNFRIAHHQTHDKNVLFAKFLNYYPTEPTFNMIFLFYFKDQEGDIFKNVGFPIEDFTDPEPEPEPEYNPIQKFTDQHEIELIKKAHQEYRIIREAHEAPTISKKWFENLFRRM